MDMDTTQTPRRRRIYLIDREFQYAYMTTWFLMMLGFIAAIVLVFAWASRNAEARFGSTAMMAEMAFLLKRVAFLVICLTIFMGCFFLLMAHRIAGPAYRLKKCLDRVARGDFDFEVTLRKRDYLKDVADALNGAIRRLRERRDRVVSLRDRWPGAGAAAAASPESRQAAFEIEAAFDDILRVEAAGEDTKATLVAEPGRHA